MAANFWVKEFMVSKFWEKASKEEIKSVKLQTALASEVRASESVKSIQEKLEASQDFDGPPSRMTVYANADAEGGAQQMEKLFSAMA